MNFNLTEEQELIQQNAREFALEYLEPIAAEIDKSERIPKEIYQKDGGTGFHGYIAIQQNMAVPALIFSVIR